MLDCPGSVEFIQEAYAAVLGCDAAVVVVEPVLERMIAVAPLLHFLDANAIPHLVFINKMDRSEVRYRDLLQPCASSAAARWCRTSTRSAAARTLSATSTW